ncbi:MAG: bifunctional tRNA (5-methylaminomethyl-2-thiouridine)(34)-methyltransferase MnmD/FAD-dependent [Pseudomonadota bacterium]|jgi:tRNA 5-methylaminomethyl-2-thiouridine biosynthesis bifunctional protein
MLPEIYPAHIELDANGLPFAIEYGDRYFSRENGLAEARHVFLQGNQLPQAWQGKEQFVIAETGFGTGLNFLATWQAWANDPQSCQMLHYISIEKHPIPKPVLAKLLANWAELTEFSTALLEQYPPVLAGFHQLNFAKHRLRLSLCFAEAQMALNELVAQVDAWYLDGFAPAKNPDLWSAAIFQALAAHSHSQTSLASFTVAGQVRRDLQEAGFVCTKRMGFGQKREMLTASYQASTKMKQRLGSQCLERPWFSLPTQTTHQAHPKIATVIGAGIAGCQIAYALARRGWQINLIERHAKLAQEASGNRAGVLSPKMTAEPDWGERFYRQSFLYALNQLTELARDPTNTELEWLACGVLQLNHNPAEFKRWQALQKRALASEFIQLVEADTATALAGIPLTLGGSYFPQGGCLYPRSWCQTLIKHPNIQLQTQTEALGLMLTPAQTWQVFNQTEGLISESTLVIVANGKDVGQFSQTRFLPLLPVRGQTTQAAASVDTYPLKINLGHEGYLTPAIQGQHIFGASFERGIVSSALKESDDQINEQQLKRTLPEFAAALGAKQSSHAAIRMTTPDRYPLVGAVVDPELFRQTYAGIQHGVGYKTWPTAPYQTGLFISAGYGSRGLTTAALCSELLAALINSEPLPIDRSLYYKLHPARFLLKKLQQNRD